MIAGRESTGMLNSLRKLFSSEQPKSYVRRWQRILMSEPARVTLHNGEVVPAMLNQLGAGGARITLAKRLRLGDIVRVDFNMSVAGHRSMTAMVVHATKDERGYQWLCGVCFIDVEPKGDGGIALFVEEEQRRRRFGFAMPRT
ncbi:MAG TPA: PilZ domain-containing protein [Candidatus Acidoferrales bacterium]|nr:PilZ domain-containing protein [Candidatus Acidoferrales bacterium]